MRVIPQDQAACIGDESIFRLSFSPRDGVEVRAHAQRLSFTAARGLAINQLLFKKRLVGFLLHALSLAFLVSCPQPHHSSLRATDNDADDRIHRHVDDAH